MSETYDLIVIGGGSAGLVAAGGAALLGAKVALIEKNKLGGDCLYTGCVPSKTFIRSARFAAQIKRATDFGFRISDFGFRDDKFASITNRIERVIKTIEPHDAPEVFEKMGVEVIFGNARFISPDELEIILQTGEKQTLKSKRFCLSTGSRPLIPSIEGLTETGFITNEEVFHLKDLPKNLVVLGAGAIGLELGQSFARLGSKVTVIEMADRVLVKEDEEVSALMEKILRGEGVEILTKTKAIKFKKDKTKKVVVCESDGKNFEIKADEILCAVGRQANVENLGLEKANVKFNQKQIFTDNYLRTTNKKIFAAGDVTGHFQFTHTADYEAQHVIQNAFLFYPLTKKVDFSVIPWATFTEPEVARVGLTESEAKAKFRDKVKVFKTEFTDNDRAQAESETVGFAKIVTFKGKRILGASIIGAHAGELIHEFVLAMRHKLTLSDLSKAIHVYPTFSKITQALATEQTLETLKSPFVQKWFARYLRIWR
ncbi:MAG TPA: FAD-dependent oxidoreductase [Pyrinomonadaceae bacterium]|nr:FAD-dependent oxidoreductase [Pyrinomonadaceae bacterium]